METPKIEKDIKISIENIDNVEKIEEETEETEETEKKTEEIKAEIGVKNFASLEFVEWIADIVVEKIKSIVDWMAEKIGEKLLQVFSLATIFW